MTGEEYEKEGRELGRDLDQLKEEGGREKMVELIRAADVFVNCFVVLCFVEPAKTTLALNKLLSIPTSHRLFLAVCKRPHEIWCSLPYGLTREEDQVLESKPQPVGRRLKTVQQRSEKISHHFAGGIDTGSKYTDYADALYCVQYLDI